MPKIKPYIFKHVLLASVFTLFFFSCQQKQGSRSTDRDSNPDTLITHLIKASLNKPLDKLDTSIVHRIHKGDFDSYQKARKKRIIQLIENNNWERMSHYLWITAEEAEELAMDFDISSNFLLYEFLSSSNFSSPQKSQILKELEEKLIKTQQDSIFYGMHEKRLLDTAFKIRVRKLHRH